MWEAVETKAGKIGVAKTKEEETKEEGRKKWEEREKQKKQKQKKLEKEKSIEMKRVVKEWEIWDKEEEAARSEAEVKKLVLEKFHR